MREAEKDRAAGGDFYYLKMRDLFDSFTRDAETFCAQRHAEEASKAKELKLDGIWEPSPFPIELPAAEQRRAAEALFSTTPGSRSAPRRSWTFQQRRVRYDLPSTSAAATAGSF